ncbi:aldo/keto reductase [Robiginitalea sp.]|nr:aldo/keto reductase [Robiginitalea sp.]
MRHSSNYSKIIAGCMTWGNGGGGLSLNEMIRGIHQCLDFGISTFDHADIYGGYTTEAHFGRAYLESGVAREKVQFISKCGIQYPSESRPFRVKHYQYDKSYIVKSVEQSLRNLNTEYLDVLLLHRPSPLMDPETVAEAIFTLRESGKVLSFGVSNFSPSQVALISSAIEIEAHQFECSLSSREALFNGVLDDCIRHKRFAMAWSPLGNFFKNVGDSNTPISQTLHRIGERYDASKSQILLAWLMHHPAQIHPVIGTTKADRQKEALAALNINLELEDWFELLESAQGHQVP